MVVVARRKKKVEEYMYQGRRRSGVAGRTSKLGEGSGRAGAVPWPPARAPGTASRIHIEPSPPIVGDWDWEGNQFQMPILKESERR
uniref:Uncharacterized protein n=1 Tax=Oryza glumipatula TaxID=40148 RepID=A0A0E0APV5_9ORYZ